ncbi:MAG: type VII secretion integral membrane protein EccD [Mycobacterium sp.]|nr:type VII secretion integral membrane protein EccD [Mycobacterium sp.]
MTSLQPVSAEAEPLGEPQAKAGHRVLVGLMAGEAMLGIRMDAVAAIGMQISALVDLVNGRLVEVNRPRLAPPQAEGGTAKRGRWAICWVDGTPLRSNRSLQDQGVLDGTRLWLRFVEDDEARIPVIEHVTSAIPAELRKRWPAVSPAWASRVAMTLVSVGVLAALGLLVRWRNQHHDWLAAAVGISIAVGLLAAATVILLRPDTNTDLAQPAHGRGRTFRLLAEVLRLNGIAALAVGIGAAVPGPLGAPQVALASAVLLAAAALSLRFVGGPLALCTAVIVVGIATLSAGLARMILMTSATTLLCCALLAVTLAIKKTPSLARWAARLRLPVFPSASGRWVFETRADLPAAVVVAGGEDPALDGPKSVRETILATDRARNIITGLLTGLGALLVVCCGWLCDPTRDQRWLAVALALTLSGAVLLHARGYEDRTHATILAVSAVAVVIVLAVRFAVQLHSAAAVLAACATLVLVPVAGLIMAAVVPNTIYNPAFKLTVEWVGYALFFAAFPLAFWLMGVFAAIRYRA